MLGAGEEGKIQSLPSGVRLLSGVCLGEEGW